MKLRKIIDAAAITLLIGVLGYFVFNHYFVQNNQAHKPRTEIRKANDILKFKSVIPSNALNTTATSSACTLFLKDAAEISMNDYANEFIDHNTDAILKTCSGAFPTVIQKKLDEAVFQCKTSTRVKIENSCFAALLAAKTSSVATIIRPDINPKELDASILLHLISDKFNNGDFFEQPEKSLALIDALLDKEPSYLAGYKIKLMLLSMSTLNKEESYKDVYQDTLDEAKRLKPNDPDILEIALAAKGDVFKHDDDPNAPKKDNTEFLHYLDQESSQHPKEWIYDYYKANALYKNGEGNYEETLAIIENALKKAPDDQRLKQTLENLKSSDEQKRAHPFIITIGFTLNDL
jgi:tetratricopeptide (TPR) repeat protein